MLLILRNIIISTLLVTGVFLFIFYSETGQFADIPDYWPAYLIAVVLAIILGASMYRINKKLNKILPWNLNLTGRFAAELGTGLLLIAILAWLYLHFYAEKFLMAGSETSFWQDNWDVAVKFGIFSLVLLFVYILINFTIFSYNRYSVYQIETMRMERDQINLRFDALKSQLSPHFLFNALNTISSLIYQDQKLAEKFIRQLAISFQHILKSENKRLVSLQEELAITNSFFFMQKIKYGDCIEMDIRIDEELKKTFIPPLALQMLVENALKHNLICEGRVLRISVADENQKFIVVSNNMIQKSELLKIGNNLVDRPRNGESHKIGLENIRKRYNYLTDKNIDVKVDDHFTVKLPVITRTYGS
ncbi:MAG: histidine kinase [Bacteroidales bacterium]|nr:histidine kinase [Bacteroidales bacterium]